jgi:site-specific DNA-methyltransferase (adenine-specific)
VTWTLLHGDCREVLATMDDASIDAIVTDPPYELGFMGKAWDVAGVAYSVDLWAEVLRVLKPGGHLLAFGGTRTYHRMTVAIEDAGFEVRDSIHWVYGSGFPKSLDVSKAIDKAAPGTAAAAEWDGWGTALKPAHEPIVVARKPLDGTVAANVLEYGTGALNIDGCRVGNEVRHNPACRTPDGSPSLGNGWTATEGTTATGRWPANFVLTHAADCEPIGTTTERVGGGANATSGFVEGYERGDGFVGRDVSAAVWRCAPGCPVAALDEQSGEAASRFFTVTERDDGSFRYVAKPGCAERNAGTDRNIHPTVKPLDLMRWLVRLVTPPGGVVLDLFAGSGTTLASAILEGFDCVGVEMTDDYLPLIEGRCTWAEKAARFGPVTGRPKVDADDTPTLFDVEDDK